VRIPGHIGRILGSYLHDIFQPRHSSFIAMTQIENYILQPCLTDSIYVTFWVFLFNFHEYVPMGVIDVYFVGNVAKVPCWRDVTNYIWTLCPSICFLLPASIRLLSFVDFFRIGCTTVLLMGVAPEAIAESFGYRLKKIEKPASYSFSHHLLTLFAFVVDFSPLYIASPRVEDEVNLCFLTDIFLFPAHFSFF
jgi:hypothetical protein